MVMDSYWQLLSQFCVCKCDLMTLSESLYMAIGLQAGEEDVQEPESEEEQRGEDLGNLWTSEFASYGWPPAQHQHSHAKERKNSEECDREGQGTRVDAEDLPFHLPVHRSHRPGQANAQKHIDCVASRHVPHRRVCILVLSGSHFTGKSV